MWVRVVGVAAALMTVCCAATVQAAQYTEVWNPPEARQAPRHVKATASAGKPAVKTSSEGNDKQQTAVQKKISAHAQVKPKPGSKVALKFRSKTTAKTASKTPTKTPTKTASGTAANRKVKMVQSKGARTLTTAHAESQKPAARSAPSQPALTMDSPAAHPATRPAPTPATVMTGAADGPTTSSGGLPPILH
jgi:hypothetical protein